MRKGWELISLEQVCTDLFAGGDVPKDRMSKQKTSEFQVPIFSNGATNDGLYGYTDEARVYKPSITVSARGTIGYTSVRNEPYLPVVRLIVLIPDPDIIELHFLNYVVKGMDFINSGTSIPQLTVPMIKRYKTPIPPLPEQKRIVEILDEAFEAIDQAKANIEQNIRNADELFQSKLNEIFSQKGEGWEEKRLDEVFTFKQGIQRGVKLQSEEQSDGKVRFIRIVDYTQGNELPRYIDNPGEKYLVDSDDISLVRYGASTGYVCKGISGALANNLFRVEPKSQYEISPFFLYYFLRSPVFQDYISKAMNGVAMPAISFKLISDIPFPLLNINEQLKIEHQLQEVETLKNELLETLILKERNLIELKKTILQKAFSGELTGVEPGFVGFEDELGEVSKAAEPGVGYGG